MALFTLVPAVLTFLSAGHETTSNQIALLAGTTGFSLMTANMILATRPAVLEQWVGGLDRVYELHKWTGVLVLVMVLVHSQVAFEQLDGVLPPGSISETAVEIAELALYPLLGLLLISVIKRIHKVPFEIPYQTWRLTHRFMGLAFVMLAFHQLFVKAPFGPTDLISHWLVLMAIAGLLAFAYTQLLAPFRARRFVVTEVEPLSGATRVRAAPKGRGLRLRPGQFAFLSARKAGLREPHPFTVSGMGTDGSVEFSIRPSGDFTRRLRERLSEGDTLMLEGGYGTFRPQDHASDQLWVAGGIGITPFLAAAEALPDDWSGQILLVHSVRNAEDAVGANRLRAVAARLDGFTYHLHDSATSGRLTGARIIALLPFQLRKAEMWFCGPAALRTALEKQFRAEDQTPRRIHFERFEFR